MTQELRDLRIVVPTPTLIESVRKLPAFSTANGVFDRSRFKLVLRASSLSEAGFLELVRGEMAQRQVLDAVTAGARVPESETGPIFKAQFEKRSADIAVFPIAAVPEPPIPDDASAQR